MTNEDLNICQTGYIFLVFRLYGTNFLKCQKKTFENFFLFLFKKVSTTQAYLSAFYLSS